jgi:alpha-tubulin suppressor-like RCC1 family protein
MSSSSTAYIVLLGLLALPACRDAESPTDPGPAHESAAAPAAVPSIAFKQVSSDGFSSCGVAADHQAWCWGSDDAGELGNGDEGGGGTPVLVAGGHAFRQVANNSHRACGLTTDNRAFCWGSGPLGDGATDSNHSSPVPVAVTGGLKFFQLDVGTAQVCGVTDPDRRIYCWGLTPKRVAGSLRFKMVTGGESHTCALTTSGEAWCWGSDRLGQLGNGGGNNGSSAVPVRVSGRHVFTQIDAGFQHTCGVTTDHKIFCWGYGGIGQIGDGEKKIRFAPRQVAGTVSFDRVSGGGGQTCAEASDNRAYCWGSNENGGIGDGTFTPRLVPTVVGGGLRFTQVSAGGWHACGVATTGDTYCWGRGGLLGDGTQIDRPDPTLIASP